MEHVNNNLSLCLAAIAGKVDPNTVKYHNGLEYQLLKIAGMTEESGGGGDDTPSGEKYTAKRVLTSEPGKEKSRAAYMVTVDLGIETIPYDKFDLTVDVDGTGYEKDKLLSQNLIVCSVPFSGDIIIFSEDNLDAGCTLRLTELYELYESNYIRAYFIQEFKKGIPGDGNNLKLQMFIYDDPSANEDAPTKREMTINVAIEENTDADEEE